MAKEPDNQEMVTDNEKRIKRKIEGTLYVKLENFWGKEVLDQTRNIVESQTKTTADYIYKMAEERVGKADKKDEKYFKKLDKKAVDIAEHEAHVNPAFNIEAAIEKEAEIKQKLEKGEITPEEALKAYSEPIPELGGGTLHALGKIMGVKTYEDMYKEINEKGKDANVRESFRSGLSNGAPSLEEQSLVSKRFQEQSNKVEENQVTLEDKSEVTK